MKRSGSDEWKDKYDLVVIGGGIYGAWTAYHAASGGLDVLIVDKGDWAAGTSSASTKLIHGGLRYLEQYHFSLVKKALIERKRLHEMLPGLVWPLQFLVPLYKGGRVKRLAMRVGLWLYDILAGGGQPVPSRGYLALNKLKEYCPVLNLDKLLCAFTYGDCQTDDARLTLEVIKAAVAEGAHAANYAEVEAVDSKKVSVKINDLLVGKTTVVSADSIVVTAGPWIPGLIPEHVNSKSVVMNKGVHLVMKDIGLKDAILNFSEVDGRVYFIIPWYGRTLVGTTDTYYKGEIDKVEVTAEDIDYLLRSANSALSGVNWRREDVIQTFAGVRFLSGSDDDNPSSVCREWVLDEVAQNIFVSIGGKLTSARVDAEKILKRAVSGTEESTNCKFYNSYDNWENFYELKHRACADVGIDSKTADWAIRRHPSEIDELLSLVSDNSGLGNRIIEDLPFCRAELILSARFEMVSSLNDLLRRRIPLQLLANLGREDIQAIAALVQDELQWNDENLKEEVERFLGENV